MYSCMHGVWEDTKSSHILVSTTFSVHASFCVLLFFVLFYMAVQFCRLLFLFSTVLCLLCLILFCDADYKCSGSERRTLGSVRCMTYSDCVVS